MKFIVNGNPIEVAVSQGEMLADVLRYRLGLIGTKIGCNEAECGSCTVMVDGVSILSCVYPAQKAAEREVLTIEGLIVNNKPHPRQSDKLTYQDLHPLQQAFITHGAVQCGFCIPGQIMTAYGLLREIPDPSEHEIQHALKDTLCRCGGYPSIIRAIQAASKSMRTGVPIPTPRSDNNTSPYKVIGTPQIRPDSFEKVTGSAVFTDDLVFEGMLHAGVKRAGIPHAIVQSIDIDNARNLPGVHAVLTAVDIPAEHNHGLVIFDWPVLVGVGEKVRYTGDAIAVVAAESREIAMEALDLINVEYTPQPVVSDPVSANLEGAPNVHSTGNLLKHIKVRKGNIDKGFAHADVIMEHTFNTAITEHAFIEPECSIARPTDSGKLEIYVGSQIPYADRNQIARVLGCQEDRVRIIGQLMGGGFGGKEDIAGQIHVALLAAATGRPVKLLFDRHESMLVHPKRHATQIRVKVGAMSDGSLRAVETELYGDTGAYASLGEKVMTRATTHSSGPYSIPNVRADCYAMYTNNPPAGAFRGFGVTQSAFAVESMMDMLSEELHIDPVELRLKNALDVGSITNTGQVLRESVGLRECIERVADQVREISGDKPFIPSIVEDSPHLVRAWGIAVGYKNTGLGGGAPDKASAEVELSSNGTLEVRTSSAELGQGLVTVLQMIVAEEFNIAPARVNVLLMDTDLTPDGGPTTASRQTYVSGNAARHAAITLRSAIASTLAEMYDLPPEEILFVEGLVSVNGHKIQLGEVVSAFKAEGREPKAQYEYWAPATKPLGKGGDMHFAFSFAAQAAQVEVNTLTGEVKVLQVVAATDVGKAINPLGLIGQVEGGVMMGLGNALTEKFVVENGYVVTDRLSRYRMPSIIHTPKIFPIIVEHPTAEGPYGAKGIGEIVSIPTTPAITNAIYNAVGVRISSLPVDQEFIVSQLNKDSAEFHG